MREIDMERQSALTNSDLSGDLASSRRLRLQTLIRLRWLAIFGQTATILVTAFWLRFPIPFVSCLLLVALLAAVNFILKLSFPVTYRLRPFAAFLLLGFDLLQLTALLFITGGLINPFAALVCVPVIISSASQPLRYTVGLLLAAVMATSCLAISPFPLPWYAGRIFEIHGLMQVGVWCAVMSTMLFAAFYAYRVSLEATELAQALAATELVLQREKHLSQLDGLAAAAAHELGTPLATISVIATEMDRALTADDPHKDDIGILRSQSERCRDILRRLARMSSEGDAHLNRLPLSSMVEEVIAPHRDLGISIRVMESQEGAGEPVLIRNPGILYGLGNIIENAVGFASSEVLIHLSFDRTMLKVTVEDDGPGFSAEVLSHIGEPYLSRRQRESKAGGLGLGLFIAKTLLERSGASITFANRKNASGAVAEILWPRARVEAG